MKIKEDSKPDEIFNSILSLLEIAREKTSEVVNDDAIESFDYDFFIAESAVKGLKRNVQYEMNRKNSGSNEYD